MHMQTRGELGSRARPLLKNLYLRVVGMSLGGRREAGSAHTTAVRKKGTEALPSQWCSGENGKAR